MKLFIIPSWYPTKLYPKSGSLFRERAQILHQSEFKIHVINSTIHPLRDIVNQSNISKNATEFIDEFGFSTLQIEAINNAPKYESGAFSQQKKMWNKLFQDALEKYDVPDYVLIYSSIWAGVSLVETLQKMKIPMGVSEHMKEFILPNGFTKKQLNGIQRCYNHASFIAATSKPLLERMKNRFPESLEKMTLIPNPVDTSLFKPNRQISKKQNNPFHFIACGLFRDEKEFPNLINAFSQVTQTYDCCLTLVGEGKQENLLRKLVEKLNLEKRVSFSGYLPPIKLVEEMTKSHALVLSSSVETFGMVIVEAMACGLPVVATRCGGPEFTIHEKTGILVEPNNVNSLANGMVKMIIQYSNFDSNEIRNYTVEKFSTIAYANSIKNQFLKIKI